MWLRSSWPWERNKMSHQDWAIIGEFISDLKLVEQGLAAPAYAESITKRAEENCENTEVVEELRRMSRLV